MLKAYEEHVQSAGPQEETYIIVIELYDWQDQSVRRVYNLLLWTPSIDTLHIEFCKLSKFKGDCLFQGITLCHLQHLSCSSIHHTSLADFVEQHPNIRSLSTSHCSEGTCALNTLSTELKLQTIGGTPSCIHTLVSKMTEWIFVTWDLNNVPINKDDALLAQLKAVHAHVYLFSTQFFPEDVEFTVRLCDSMPYISTLRLMEAPTHSRDRVSIFLNISKNCYFCDHKNYRQFLTLGPAAKECGPLAYKTCNTWRGSKFKHTLLQSHTCILEKLCLSWIWFRCWWATGWRTWQKSPWSTPVKDFHTRVTG